LIVPHEDMDILQAEVNIDNWLMAERMGISEDTLLLWLSHEMPSKQRQFILAAMKQLNSDMMKNIPIAKRGYFI
jgi:hypothetical protein